MVSSPKVILVVSARQGEGKTSTVANVATTLAEAGKRVLVLDHDLRAPEAHLYLDVPNGAGVAELLDSPEDQDLLSLSRPTAVPGVRLVTGGNSTDRPTALPTRTAQLIREARELADIVLIDTTPMLDRQRRDRPDADRRQRPGRRPGRPDHPRAGRAHRRAARPDARPGLRSRPDRHRPGRAPVPPRPGCLVQLGRHRRSNRTRLPGKRDHSDQGAR